MDALHRLLAYGAVVAAAIGIGWSAIATVTRRSGGPSFERFQAVSSRRSSSESQAG